MKGPGGLFEKQVMASMPKDWSGLYARKVPDPPARRTACFCGGLVVARCAKCKAAQQGAARFTSPNMWDIEIRMSSPHGLIELLIECKSTIGNKRSDGTRGFATLGADVLKKKRSDGTMDDAQERAMLAAAEAGSVAGVLWEARGPTCPGYPSALQNVGALFLPIGPFLAVPPTIGRKSWTWEHAARHGTPLEIHVGRGRTNRYFRMDRFLKAFLDPLGRHPLGRHPREAA